jgi:processive 1,2-diacylglycerol beta-glucosyltransferase
VGYTECVNDLMDISNLIVSKPGGLTSAEALTKSLPIIIVSPLPGQESLNTKFLLETGVALKVENLLELRSLVEELLNDKTKLEMLRQRAGAFGRVDSAQNIARFILNMA